MTSIGNLIGNQCIIEILANSKLITWPYLNLFPCIISDIRLHWI